MEMLTNIASSTSFPQLSDNRWRYSGKEEQNAVTGLQHLDYGARHYDPFLGSWTTPDPMAEKYYGWSPYNFCADDPVMKVDPNGSVVIFVNGYLGFGSPQGGDHYWNKKFVLRSRQVFSDEKVQFLNINYQLLSSAKSRKDDGYEYAKHYLQGVIHNLKKGETIKLVSHSMGAAFSEGIAQYLIDEGVPINILVHFEPYQAGRIKSVGSTEGILSIDYQTLGDWVIEHVGKGDIVGADSHIKATSTSDVLHIHRDAIDNTESWDRIEKIISDFLRK